MTMTGSQIIFIRKGASVPPLDKLTWRSTREMLPPGIANAPANQDAFGQLGSALKPLAHLFRMERSRCLGKSSSNAPCSGFHVVSSNSVRGR
jgi:hypothetical protein